MIAINAHEDIIINGSRSMPGSRRNSGRSDQGYDQLQQSKTSLASTGRRSIDEATALQNSKRSASLRLNRNSVTDLRADMSQLTTPQFDSKTRRKSSSALAQVKLNRSYSLKSDHHSVSTDSVGSASDLMTDNQQPSSCDASLGEIKLGFIMTKGFLEIEVICARGLPMSANQQPPGKNVSNTECVELLNASNTEERITC